MKKSKLLILFATLILVVSCIGCYLVFAANEVNLEITGNGAFTISVNGNTSQSEYIGGVQKGAEVTLTATGENFLYWLDENKNTIEESTYTFVAEFDTSFEACFAPTSGSWVVYRNTNYTKQVLGKATYTSADAFTEHLASKAYKYGYVFAGWSKTIDEIKSKISAGISYIEINPEYDVPVGSYSISVNGGSVNGENSGAFVNNTQIAVIAEEKEGKEFCHWIDADDRIVSDQASFNLYVYKNDTFTAVYKDACGNEHTPEIWLELSVADGMIHSYAQIFVPAGYTDAEYGLIYAKGNTPSDIKFTLDSVGDNIKKISYDADAVAFVNHFSIDDEIENRYVYVRAYLTCAKDEEVYTAYSGNEALYEEVPVVFDDVSGKKQAIDYAYDGSAALVTYENRDEISFRIACQKYLEEGYELYGKINNLGPVKSATYIKGNKLAHIYYSSNENELAIVTSDSEGANLPKPVAFSGDKSKTSVTQMPGSKGSTSGMGYIIRLADGTFIIFDGGYTEETDDIYNALVELNGGSESGIVIRAWLLTHGDGDHNQALNSFLTKYTSKVTFEYLMTAPIKDSTGGSKTTGSGVASTEAKATQAGVKICRVHTGMVFNFCDVELQILMAPESIFAYSNPSAHKAYTDSTYEFYGRGDLNGYQNETSIVSKIKTSDNRKTFIVLGDAGHAVADKLLAMYGNDSATSYLKSDICQVAHHGCETFSLEGYKVINADIWYYPSSTYLYSNMSTEKGPQYTNGSLQGRNWYILQELKKMGTTHVVRDTDEAVIRDKDTKVITSYTGGDNHQSLNK